MSTNILHILSGHDLLQTESDIRSEFDLSGISVESRIFKTSEDPIKVIEDLFVSHSLYNNFTKFNSYDICACQIYICMVYCVYITGYVDINWGKDYCVQQVYIDVLTLKTA